MKKNEWRQLTRDCVSRRQWCRRLTAVVLLVYYWEELLILASAVRLAQRLCHWLWWYFCSGDQDPWCDHGCVHHLLAAVLHPSSSQAVLPGVPPLRTYPRLAHQSVPVARLCQQFSQPDHLRPFQPRLPHAVQRDLAVPLPGYQSSSAERELRGAVWNGGDAPLAAGPGGHGRRAGKTTSSVLRVNCRRVGGGWTTVERRDTADFDHDGAQCRTGWPR